jgi:beta-fructofuranosidase
MWECPQLFEIDGSHVLVTSIWEDDVLHYVAYGVGTYAEGKFTARSWGQLSYGKSYYAPSFFRDKDGAPSLIFWVRGVISPEGQWASALSIPHTLSLEGDTLVATPHADLTNYSQPGQLEQVDGKLFETELNDGADLRCTVTTGTVIGLTTLDEALVTLRHDGDSLAVTAAGNADFADALFPADAGSEVRVIIDAGVVEISGRQGIMAVPLPIVDAPVTLTVSNASARQLFTVQKPAGNTSGIGRQAALSGQP